MRSPLVAAIEAADEAAWRSGVVAESQLRSTARDHVGWRICRTRDNPPHHRSVPDATGLDVGSAIFDPENA